MFNKKNSFFKILCRIIAFILIVSMSYNISYADDNGITPSGISYTGDDGATTLDISGASDQEVTASSISYVSNDAATTVTVGGDDGTYSSLFEVFADMGLSGDLVVKVQADLTENQAISVDPARFTSVTIESSDPDVNRGFSSIPWIAFNGVPSTLKRMGTVNNRTIIIGGGTVLSDRSNPATVIPTVNVTVENCKFNGLAGSQNASVAGNINLNCSGSDTDIGIIYGGINLKEINSDASVDGDISLIIDGGKYGSVYGVSNIGRWQNYGESYTKDRTLTVKGNVTTSVNNANVSLLCGQGAVTGWGGGDGFMGTVLTTEGKTTVDVSHSSIGDLHGGSYNQYVPGFGIPQLRGALEFHLSDVEINMRESTVKRSVTALNDTFVGVPFPFEQTGNTDVTIENSTISESLFGGYSTGNGSIQYQVKGTSKITKKLIGNTLDPSRKDADIYNSVTVGNTIDLNTDSALTVSALGGFTNLSLGGSITVTGDQDNKLNNIDIVDCNAARISIKNLQDWTNGNELIVSTAVSAPSLVESDFTKGWTEEKPVIKFIGTKPGGWYLYDVPSTMVTVTFDPTPGSIQNVIGSKVLNYAKGTTLSAADIPTPSTTEANTRFAGWYTDINDEGTKLSTENLPVIQGNITYHAKWQQDSGSGGGNNGGSSGGGGGGSSNHQEQPLISDEHFAYIKGYPDGTFRSDNPMTRAEVAVMFYRLLKDKTGIGSDQFSDVDRTAWYAEAVSVLQSKGILSGYEDGTFRPDSYITRAEFSTVVSRFQSLKEGSKRFSDVPFDHWAYDYIASAAERGFITGYPDGTFRPERAISRAEVVSMTNRVLGRSADQEFVDRGNGVKKFSDLWSSHWAYYDVMESSNGHDYRMKDGREEWIKLKN